MFQACLIDKDTLVPGTSKADSVACRASLQQRGNLCSGSFKIAAELSQLAGINKYQ